MPYQTLRLAHHAPAKPVAGQPCNGCGVCCAAETCPAGRLLFRRQAGPCPALTWDDGAGCYRCGLLTSPGDHLRWLPSGWTAPAARAFARWIAAGRGCDSDAEVMPADPDSS